MYILAAIAIKLSLLVIERNIVVDGIHGGLAFRIIVLWFERGGNTHILAVSLADEIIRVAGIGRPFHPTLSASNIFSFDGAGYYYSANFSKIKV